MIKTKQDSIVQGLLYFCGTENHRNHGNWPKFRITEITENHGKSRNWKSLLVLLLMLLLHCVLLFAIAAAACRRPWLHICGIQLQQLRQNVL